MNKLSEKMHSFVKTLSSTERDELYRYLWSDYVRNDVREHLSRDDIGLSDEDVNAIVEDVVEYYVYNGEYDCELSYWDNISLSQTPYAVSIFVSSADPLLQAAVKGGCPPSDCFLQKLF